MWGFRCSGRWLSGLACVTAGSLETCHPPGGRSSGPTDTPLWAETNATRMRRQLRDRGPGLLVPLAWLVVGAAHADLVSGRSIFIAHLVMAAFITFFLATGWAKFEGPVLRGWQAVIIAGLVATVLGALGFLVSAASTPLWVISIGGWMLLPAIGLAYTAALLSEAREIYIWSATLTMVGAVTYFTAVVGNIRVFPIVGIVGVGIGQSIGILDAIARS